MRPPDPKQRRGGAATLSSSLLCCTLPRMMACSSLAAPAGSAPIRGALAVLLLLALGLAPGGCLAESTDSTDSGVISATRIRASGEAVVVVAPDRAWVDLAIVTRDVEASRAVEANAGESKRVTTALGKALGQGAEISSGGYSLAPNYKYITGQGQRLDGFIVRNRLRVTLEDVTAAGRVIDAASEAGASEIQQVSYGLADDAPAQRQALADATRSGVERAGVMAKAIDMQVIRVLSVEDSGAAPAPIVREVRMLAKSAGPSSAPPTTLSPGGIRVHASVTVYVEVGP